MVFSDFQVTFYRLKKMYSNNVKETSTFANVFTNFFLYITMFVWKSISQVLSKKQRQN